MPLPNFYKNRILKHPWHHAEVGGSPRLKLWPVIFKRLSADAGAQFVKNRTEPMGRNRGGRTPMLRVDSLHGYVFTCSHAYMRTRLHACASRVVGVQSVPLALNPWKPVKTAQPKKPVKTTTCWLNLSDLFQRFLA